MKKTIFSLLMIFSMAVKSNAQLSGPATVCLGDTVTLNVTGAYSVLDWHNTLHHTGYDAVYGVSTCKVWGLSPGKDTIKVNYIYIGTDMYLHSALSTFVIQSDHTPYEVLGIDTICLSGATATYTETSDTIGTWYLTNSNAFNIGGTLHGLHRGNDTLMYIIHSACGIDTAYKNIRIDSMYSINITGDYYLCGLSSLDTLIPNISGGVWSVTDTTILSMITNIVISNNYGADTCIYTISNFCGTDHVKYPIYVYTTAQCDSIALIALGTKEIKTNIISLYPNPSNGLININVSEPTEVVITDLLGSIILHVIIDSDFQFNNLPKGILIVSLNDKHYKVIVE